MKNLIEELEKYLKVLNVEQLYNNPGHKDSKNWLAEVAATLKTNRKSAYKKFSELSQHIYPSIPFVTRKHAAEQLDVLIRQLIAEYKRGLIFIQKSKNKTYSDKIDKIKIFLSYSTKNKIGAGQIKTWLTDFGFKVFLAHEDIEPSLEWQNVIIQNLKECHVFIPVITKYFYESRWTDQESGMAYVLDKLIISVSVDRNTPQGFLGKFQSLKLDKKDIHNSCTQIVKTIMKNPKFSPIILDLLIKFLPKSKSYASAGWKSKLLGEYKNFSKDQINLIFKAAIENNQISFEYDSRITIKKIIKNHPQLIDKNLLDKLNSIDPDYSFN